jgi:uncharacterized protein YbaA (DUF1428 family)
VHSTFTIVIVVVCAVGLVVGVFAALTSKGVWQEYADRAMVGDRGKDVPDEREAEIRQLVEARNARKQRRGEPIEEIEVEVARLVREAAFADAGSDPELIAEIRQMVDARNARRARRGEPPLDVDQEVARILAQAGESSSEPPPRSG